MKRFITAIFILCFTGFCVFSQSQKVNRKLPFTKGLNLSSWLEPFGFANSSKDWFGEQDFKDIKSLGVEAVRVPIHFETWSSGAPDYIVEDWVWEYVDNAVAWCEHLGMYILIDFHNLCDENSYTKPDVEKMLSKIWPQIAERYKDRSAYVLYEVYNEPHGIDCAKWGKVQGKIIKLIRSIDKKHSIIVGAADFNSIEKLLSLPKYNDDNLIYNFHEYSPFLFTHQGAAWTYTKRLTKIPFPYVKEKMPPLPPEPTDSEKWIMENYPADSSEQNLVAPLDKAVAFVNKRNAALMCNEYGVYMPFADVNERANWYRQKAAWLSDRNIARLSWDYKGGFGIFKKIEGAEFPYDVDATVVKAMGFTPPQVSGNAGSAANNYWIDNAKKQGHYTIYRNTVAKGIKLSGWMSTENNMQNRLGARDENGGDAFIHIPACDMYNGIEFDFGKESDFSSLAAADLKLEFEVRSNTPNQKLSVYFRNLTPDDEKRPKVKAWRAINSLTLKSDGKWHKVSIPLSEFKDSGAWNVSDNKWYNSEGLFDWHKVRALIFDFQSPVTKGISFRNIEIKK